MNNDERYLLNHCYQHAIEHENQTIYEMSENEIVWNYMVYKKTGVLIEPDDWKDSFDSRNEKQNRKDEQPKKLNFSKITNIREMTNKGILRQQLELLAENSKKAEERYLSDITEAMIVIYDRLLNADA